jgi:hypothetical protein
VGHGPVGGGPTGIQMSRLWQGIKQFPHIKHFGGGQISNPKVWLLHWHAGVRLLTTWLWVGWVGITIIRIIFIRVCRSALVVWPRENLVDRHTTTGLSEVQSDTGHSFWVDVYVAQQTLSLKHTSPNSTTPNTRTDAGHDTSTSV